MLRQRPIFRSAYNPALTNTEATIWPKNTAYSFPVSASTMTLYSTSVSDTTQLVLIEGLDADYIETSEVLMLNGQTGRATANQYLRINTLTVLSDSPQGDISVGTGSATLGVPANTYGFIKAGDNLSASAVYTIPAGYTLLLTAGSISAGSASGSQTVTANFHSRINGVNYLTAKISLANSFQFFPYNPELTVPEKTDVYNNAVTSSGTMLVAATFNGYLVKNKIG